MWSAGGPSPTGSPDVLVVVSADDTTQRLLRNRPDTVVRQWVRASFVVGVSAAASMIAEAASEEAEAAVVSVVVSIAAAVAEGLVWATQTVRLRVLAVGMEVASAVEEAMIAGSVEAEVDATMPTSSLCRPEVVVAAIGIETVMEVAGTRTTPARNDHTTAVVMTTRGSGGDTRMNCMM